MMPTVAYSQLRTNIQLAYPNNSVSPLSLLSKKNLLQHFWRKRKRSKIEAFDPLQPPPKLFVIFTSEKHNFNLL